MRATTESREATSQSPAEKPHICFICPYIGAYLNPGSRTDPGGAERQQHLLASQLRDSGYAVSFIAFEADGRPFERIDGFDVWRTLPTRNDLVRAPEALGKLLASIRRVEADVFYVRGNPPLCILASYGCTLLRESLIYVVANDSNIDLSRLPTHHSMFRYTLPKLAYLDAVRRADRVVAQTEYQRHILEEVFDIPATVVPNGITLPPTREIVPPADRTHVLWVGSLDPEQKRPDRFVDLAERLPDVQFRMIGSTNDEAYHATIVDAADELSNLTFGGFVPPDRIDRYYRNAVALVNTSEYEGFPNTFLEAWRYGVPVVSLKQTLDGVLTDQRIGHRAGTMDELARNVADLWNDRETAGETGRRGRRFVQEHFTLDRVVEDYERIIGDIVE